MIEKLIYYYHILLDFYRNRYKDNNFKYFYIKTNKDWDYENKLKYGISNDQSFLLDIIKKNKNNICLFCFLFFRT